MARKLYSVVCRCWKAVYCTCKDAVTGRMPEPYVDTIEYWKRIEGVDQYPKKRY